MLAIVHLHIHTYFYDMYVIRKSDKSGRSEAGKAKVREVKDMCNPHLEDKVWAQHFLLIITSTWPQLMECLMVTKALHIRAHLRPAWPHFTERNFLN